ncbi:hypothetical protein FACS1894166_01700 [Bacilli bacterium]|nr:hypothetical protein FACS1894166_01700 [Bacilli bacterium]
MVNEDGDNLIGLFVKELLAKYGGTAMLALVSGAQDRSSTQTIFSSLSYTITQIEQIVLAIISFMVIIIVMLITILIISDSKRLAAILKSLGYSDQQNLMSFLSIYIPVVVLGLILAIPLSFVLVSVFQAVIFNGAGILILGTIK